ncbi:MAG: cell wall hydrolase [Lachnospiraceae bacterium]|nr:cell wall hydrolase [Lachnospiraceae bacterium]
MRIETKRLSMISLRAAAVLLLALFFAMPSQTRPVQAAPLSLSSLSGLTGEEEQEAFSNEGWSKDYSAEELKYLACVIYCETEPLGYEARVALGNIVMNRVNSTTDWGHVNTIKDVIYDTKWGQQFDCAAPKKKLGNKSMMDRAFPLFDTILAGETGDYEWWQVRGMTGCIEAAKDVMCGIKTVPDSFVYCRGEKYFSVDIASCKETGRRYLIIEKHIYYEN